MKQWQVHLFMFLLGVVWYIILGYLMYTNSINLYMGIFSLIVTAFLTVGLNARWFLKTKRENI